MSSRFNELIYNTKGFKTTCIQSMVQEEGDYSIDNILDRSTVELNDDNFALMSIDIDSFDYYVFGSIKKYRPKICIVETSSGYTPDRDFVSRDAWLFSQVSAELGETIGYKCVIHTGNFFVRDDLVHLLLTMTTVWRPYIVPLLILIQDKVSNGTSYFRGILRRTGGSTPVLYTCLKNFINNKEERHILQTVVTSVTRRSMTWCGVRTHTSRVLWKVREPAGDLESIEVKNHTGNWISNWEYLHGLEPTNIRPKIYYEPNKIPGLGDTILVDLSKITINHNDTGYGYNLRNVQKTYFELLKRYPDKKFVGVNFKQDIDSSKYNPEVDETIDVESIYHYCDLMNSSYGVCCFYSGSMSLAFAVQDLMKI